MYSERIENLEISSVSYLSAGVSHVGLRRQKNEDRFLLDALHNFYLVVDGIGGNAGGEIAAQIAVDTIEEVIKRTIGDDEKRLRDSIVCANNAIVRASRNDDNLSGMGCVLTALLINDQVATVANVGDSRVYKIHSGGIDLLTTDHSVVGELGKGGELSEIRLMRHPRRNEVLRCVGFEEKIIDEQNFVDIITTDFQPEEAFLLCSDGVSDMITSSRLLEIILAHAESPKTIVKRLVDEANKAGGKDNITAIFVMGERFQQAAELMKSDPTQTYKESVISILLNRWVFLFYGLLLGAAVVYLLYSYRLV